MTTSSPSERIIGANCNKSCVEVKIKMYHIPECGNKLLYRFFCPTCLVTEFICVYKSNKERCIAPEWAATVAGDNKYK